ncbi:polyphosphate polymerase domain-containing protein [Nocardioides caldifontis]|uniref:polyphosphate polymerase domain-containing protein n=1 Tax=Nocardioides caldifontis TaxID=2588938 RepID=UPI0011E054B1|nr:polyphosphate polymerase domain-containing protein [Nocardioides caldifontis]
MSTAVRETVPGSAALPTALSRLPPISLPELVQEARLLRRVDRKYVVPLTWLPVLIGAVPTSTHVLDIDRQRAFAYRSAYLDTPDRRGYHLAGRGRRRRFKVRTRAYLDTGGCWLEVKTRSARGLTVKQRIPHPDAELAALNGDGLAFIDDVLRGAGLDDVHAEQLGPVLATAYRRTTLYLPDSGSRATIDVELGWTSLSGKQCRDLDRPSLAIVETKTGSTPSAVDRLLWTHGHRPARISKYGVGMAALHSDLPRLKWHRVMQRHLAIPAAPTHSRRTT